MRTFSHTELELQNGGELVLNEDGSIEYFDADGNRQRNWDTDDPEWESQARHFRLSRADLEPDTAL